MKPMAGLRDLGYEDDDLIVKVSELLVATADGSDELIDDSVTEVLHLLRERMSMDVVFVAEFTDGRRVFRRVDSESDGPIVVGASDLLEESWCQRVVDGRMPPYIHDASLNAATRDLEAKLTFRVGTHIAAPVVLKNGEVYGTLCCFSFSPVDKPDPRDLKRLQYTAQLTANKIDRARVSRTVIPGPENWLLQDK